MPEMPDSPTPSSDEPSAQAALARWFVLIVAVFAVLAVAFVWISRSWTIGEPIGAPSAESQSADFRLASLDGAPLGPPDFNGKVVVIDFWATWCGPCRLQAQILDELHREYDPGEVQFLAIDLGEDEATVRDYVAKAPFPYPVLLDPTEELSMRYEIFGLPTVMIVDPKGRITFKRTGVTDERQLKDEIEKALSRGEVNA